jgi:hypothetical protein
MKSQLTGAALALLVATAIPAIGAGTAHADDDEIERRGSCSGSTDWKIKTKPDDGGLEVEGEIDSNRSGQNWRWTLRRNGNVVDRGTGTTHPPSGSFEVERKTGNAAGTDRFKFRAVNKGSGEVCVARVSI